MAKGKIKQKKFSNLVGIIARTETLILGYKRIKKNKGALTEDADVDPNELNKYNDEQKIIYYQKNIFPDGISLEHFEITRRLLLKGQYPWGSS